MTKIAFIAGSPTQGSRLFGLTQYLEDRLVIAGYEIEFVSAADLPAEDLLRADFNSPAIKQAIAAVEGAAAVIIASPVYKASYSGALKTILDLLPQKGLQGKVVLPFYRRHDRAFACRGLCLEAGGLRTRRDQHSQRGVCRRSVGHPPGTRRLRHNGAAQRALG